MRRSFHLSTDLVVLLLAAATLGFASPRILKADCSWSQRIDVRQRLKDATMSELGKNVRLTDEASQDVTAILNAGATKLQSDLAGEETIRQAERDAIRFAKYLKVNGRRHGDEIDVDHETVLKVRDIFCPCYPFC